MKFYTTSVDTKLNILNVSLLLDRANINTIFYGKNFFSYVGLVMKKCNTIITGSHLILYNIGKTSLVMPRDTRIRVFKIVYLPAFIRILLNF